MFLKTPVYRFDLYGRYRIRWTDADILWQCYLELVYKPKYQIWWESFLWTEIAHFQYRPVANRSPFAKFEVPSSLRSGAIVMTTDGRTDRHSSNVLEFLADQMPPINLGSQINISAVLLCNFKFLTWTSFFYHPLWWRFCTGVLSKKFNSVLFAHRPRFYVCSSYGDRQTEMPKSSRWSRIYILHRVSRVSFDLLHFA